MSPSPRPEIGHQAHEAFVLMVLVMAVEQAGTRIVGDEINLKAAWTNFIENRFSLF
jgi:hypothetical protein